MATGSSSEDKQAQARHWGAALARYFPILEWGREYDREAVSNDLIAAVIVTIMLIPQSLAYALLAGLPPQVGLYASMAPLIAYGIFGTSRTLAVGPVAVVSLMTAAALGRVAGGGTAEYVAAALTLALLSGGILLLLGLLRLGFLANFLSHPVISGFITASGIVIAASQLKGVLGIDADGHALPELLQSIWANLGSVNIPTFVIGVGVIAFLYWARTRLKPLLLRTGMRPRGADFVVKSAPVLAVLLTITIAWYFELGDKGVALVGSVPQGLPGVSMPDFSRELLAELAIPALLISIIGFVESVSVAQTLGAKRRQRIEPDQELVALGASNIGAAFTGGYPVTGGFARSVVNFDAGAQTPAAGMFTAVGIGIATLALTPFLFFLPKATLSATIIVAVLTLVDFRAIGHTWRYSKGDGAAMLATILVTLAAGVETGILTGVGLSLAIHLYRTSRPHYAIVGQVPGTEHFRNVLRHDVAVAPHVLSLRVDESLYFPNARFLEDKLFAEIAQNPEIRHVVLMCPAVNSIDASALHSLEAINHRLADSGVTLHLSEVKGPVMDRLEGSGFLEELTGGVFLTQCDAMRKLAPELTKATLRQGRSVDAEMKR